MAGEGEQNVKIAKLEVHVASLREGQNEMKQSIFGVKRDVKDGFKDISERMGSMEKTSAINKTKIATIVGVAAVLASMIMGVVKIAWGVVT